MDYNLPIRSPSQMYNFLSNVPLVYTSRQCCDTGPRVLPSYLKDCPHLVASYDSQGCRGPSYSDPHSYWTRRKLQAELIITFKICLMQNSKDCKIRAFCTLQDLYFAVVLFEIVHPYMDVTVAGEGVQCSAPTVFEQGGILSCHTCYDTGRRLHSLNRRPRLVVYCDN